MITLNIDDCRILCFHFKPDVYLYVFYCKHKSFCIIFIDKNTLFTVTVDFVLVLYFRFYCTDFLNFK